MITESQERLHDEQGREVDQKQPRNFTLYKENALIYVPLTGETIQGVFFTYSFQRDTVPAHLRLTYGVSSAPFGEEDEQRDAPYYAEINYNNQGELTDVTMGSLFDTPELGTSAVITTKRDFSDGSWNYQIRKQKKGFYRHFIDNGSLQVLLQDDVTRRIKHVEAPLLVPIDAIEACAISASPQRRSADDTGTWINIGELVKSSVSISNAAYDISTIQYPISQDYVLKTNFLPLQPTKDTELDRQVDPQGNIIFNMPHRT